MIHLSFLFWAAILMSVLVLVHELAHLLAALAMGVKVEVFSLGFGPRLTGFCSHNIDFRLSAIPLGGYVRMYGESSTVEQDVCRSFQSKSRAARAFILLAGPLINCLLAPTLFSALYWHGFNALIPSNNPATVRLRAVLPNSPAAQAGLRSGDIIETANDKKLRNRADAAAVIRKSAHQPLRLVISHNGRTQHVTVTPRAIVNGTTIVGQIGAAFEAETIQLPLWPAIRYGTWTTYKLAQDMMDTIVGLVTGKVSASNLVGPIGIAQISGEAAAQGLLMFLAILAFISLNLGLFNLLPIPVLDGGALTVLCIEALAGRDLKPKVKENITKLGFAVIVGIMSMVTFNDLVRTFAHLISKP